MGKSSEVRGWGEGNWTLRMGRLVDCEGGTALTGWPGPQGGQGRGQTWGKEQDSAAGGEVKGLRGMEQGGRTGGRWQACDPWPGWGHQDLRREVG